MRTDTLGGMKKPLVVVVAALVVAVPLLGACGGSSSGGTTEPAGRIELTPAARLIDVRTPAEFTEGHVQGAVNIDVSADDFGSRIATLDKETPYSIYCRSGNRSAVAAEIMRNAGFVNVVDLGSVEDAAKALALPVVAQ